VPLGFLCSLLVGQSSCDSCRSECRRDLIVHYNTSLESTGGTDVRDGGLAACDSAVVQAPADSIVLWFVYAAFPPEASPRVKTVTFGCEFDENQVGLLWWATRPGATEILAQQEASWPYTGSGTSIAFSSALTETVDEIYAFAGYGPEGRHSPGTASGSESGWELRG